MAIMDMEIKNAVSAADQDAQYDDRAEDSRFQYVIIKFS